MIWPWKRHRIDTADAHRRARAAELQAKLSASRREAAEDQAAHAETVSRKLRNEIDRNGWLELLQTAWGGK